jgi:hypothetical protein
MCWTRNDLIYDESAQHNIQGKRSPRSPLKGSVFNVCRSLGLMEARDIAHVFATLLTRSRKEVLAVPHDKGRSHCHRPQLSGDHCRGTAAIDCPDRRAGTQDSCSHS